MRHQLKLLIAIIISLLGASLVLAQENLPPQPPDPILFLTETRSSSPPAIDVRLFGYTAQGDALPIDSSTLTLTHDGTAVSPIPPSGSETVGTFTLFLIDIPPGVADQFDTIATDIKAYATAATMQEETDSVAIYQVGETAAIEILAPSSFHNAVQNTFASPIQAAAGATALVDSINSLLDQLDTLKPDPAMAASIVIFSDGTDIVSGTDINTIGPRAAELGVPLHTVWLQNADLPGLGQELGQDYLETIAILSRGRSATITDDTAVTNIWSHIATFRSQTVLRYIPETVSGGSYTVNATLTANPAISASGSGTLPANLPTVSLNLPADSRALTLPAIDEPVNLRFSASTGWLDGETRELVAATLLINDTAVAEIPPANLEEFTVEVANLTFGENTVAIAVLDNQGLRAASPELTLTVSEGDRDIPEALDAGGGGSFLTILILLVVAIIGLLIGLYILSRMGYLSGLTDMLPRGPSRRREPRMTIEDESGQPAPAGVSVDQGRTIALLEVLASDSAVKPQMSLRNSIVRLGRSPSQSDIAFENDITVSRLHATLRLEGEHFRIFDEGSTSGTWVNDQRVPSYGIQLLDGDEVHLGQVHLRYRQT